MVHTKKDYSASYSPQRKKPKVVLKSLSSIANKPSLSGSTESTSANIKVAVRVRPPNERENGGNFRMVVKPIDGRMLIFDPKEEDEPFFYQGSQQPSHNYLKRANKEMQFMFDNVFDSVCSNEDIFNESTKYLINSLMDGYNCSVFVYGATGAGKTHTMLGREECPGITYLTMQELFDCMDTHRSERDFEICVSYLEVYNENVHDLLKPSGPLNLRDDGKFGVIVAGLTSKSINTAKELLDMLDQGNKNRTQHPTDANAESSRSHAVFQVYVKMRTKSSGQVKIVKLTMIDLAGSERASATGCKGDRFKEGANINRSLLALGNCINQLADGSKFIPYRDSKLTRLLKDSIGGNCRTVMIANVAPTSASYEDTYNTLKYAARANKIQLRMKKNIVSCNNHISQYIQRAEELAARVAQLENELAESKKNQNHCHVTIGDTDRVDLVTIPEEFDTFAMEWRKKIESKRGTHLQLVKELMDRKCTQRKLAARALQKRRAAATVAALCCDASDSQLGEACVKDSASLEMSSNTLIRQGQVMANDMNALSRQIHLSEIDLSKFTEEALKTSPSLEPLISSLSIQSNLVLSECKEKHLEAIATMEYSEINNLHGFTQMMLKMLKKYYLFLKGQGFVTSSMIQEYNNLMLKARNSRTVTWEDQQENVEGEDNFLKFILHLNSSQTEVPDLPNISIHVNNPEDEPKFSPFNTLVKPVTVSPKQELPLVYLDTEDDLNATRVIESDLTSDLLPLETIAKTKAANSITSVYTAKPINPNDLNSTFVLSNKNDGEPLQKKLKPSVTDTKRVLSERTNVLFNTNAISKVKPVAISDKTVPYKKISKENKSGFGSSVNRFRFGEKASAKINNVQVGCKAVREKERRALTSSATPYSRPPISQSSRL